MQIVLFMSNSCNFLYFSNVRLFIKLMALCRFPRRFVSHNIVIKIFAVLFHCGISYVVNVFSLYRLR